MQFDLACHVNGSGLGRSLTELNEMPLDHILRDRDRLLELYERLEAAMRVR